MTQPDMSVHVVLGSSVTSLAVIRGVARIGGKAIVVDHVEGIAACSRHCSKFILIPQQSGMADANESCLSYLTTLNIPSGNAYLIATSDAWLTFIYETREILARYFVILHSENRVLDLCLDKLKFYNWCELNDLKVPRTLYDLSYENICQLTKFIPLPVLVKLSNRYESKLTFPKTVELKTEENLDDFVRNISPDQSEKFLISESLLPRKLVQYSIPFCRNRNKKTITYAAIKQRPPPAACRVGTYFTVSEKPDLELLCVSVAEKLDYFGIGEMEVLHDQDTKENFIIELNARPWEQYSHQFALGYDFLDFLTTNKEFDTPLPTKRTASWVSLYDDFYYFKSTLSGNPDRLKRVFLYLASLTSVRACSHFSLSDPMPLYVQLKQIFTNKFFKAKPVNTRKAPTVDGSNK